MAEDELLDPDWVVANAVTQEMTCRRCGGHEPLPQNMLLNWAADIMAGFVRRHADCEEVGPDDVRGILT